MFGLSSVRTVLVKGLEVVSPVMNLISTSLPIIITLSARHCQHVDCFMTGMVDFEHMRCNARYRTQEL